jgi:hypothetical protein
MKIIRLTLSLVALAVLVFAASTPTLGNVWSLATARGFFIPKESSLFTFRVTEENHGSGEWWLYGEDGQNFFALHSREPSYFVQTTGEAAKCSGFSPRNQRTWCSPRAVPTP